MADKVMTMAEFEQWTKKFTSKAAINNGLKRAGTYCVNKAKKNLTDNDSVKSGDLRRSIRRNDTLISEGKVIIGTTVEYAPYVEYGTGKYATNGQGRPGGWAYEGPPHEVTVRVYDPKSGFSRPMKNELGKALTRTIVTTTWWTWGSRPKPFLLKILTEDRYEIMSEFRYGLEDKL